MGAVRRASGEIYYLEYNGTVDSCLSHLYKTPKEVVDNWRKQTWKFCKCYPIVCEPVEIAVLYGDGYYWNGFICPTCMVITDNLRPHGDDYQGKYYSAKDGLPDWYPNKEEYEP